MNTYTLVLPQLEASINSPFTSEPGKEIIFPLGGRPPKDEWFKEAAKNRNIWAVDHGIDICRRCSCPPSLLIGDNDSATNEGWNWGESLGIPVDKHPRAKDYTDTQLALVHAADSSPESFLILTGALGGRFDHACSTIHSAAHAKNQCCIADETEVMFFLKAPEDSITVKNFTKLPTAVSLLPITSSAAGVTTSGLKWELHDTILLAEKANAVSNEMLTAEFSVSKSGVGILGVYMYFS